MSGLVTTLLLKELEGHPRLSIAVGWASIALWIVVYSPQILLCYREQSGEGLSLIFLAIWLAGDVTNLLGSLGQNLSTTMVLLAAYYSICDCILIFQVFYYRQKRASKPHLYEPRSPSLAPVALESDPLLVSSNEAAEALQLKRQQWRDLLAYAACVTAVVAVAGAAWVISGRQGSVPREREEWNTGAQVVGWMSAFLYLGSRLPQIAKNMETKCHGLSLALFAVAVAGNSTYVASILLNGLDYNHLLINASWLVGSGATIFLDFIVLGQFYYYSDARKLEEVV